jgi:methyltransferase (TIGR00027 family)
MRTAAGTGTFNGPDPFLTIRTRFFDDALLAAVRETSIDQVVILAAGMAARAFRLAWPGGVRVFEVDEDVSDPRDTRGGLSHRSLALDP